MHGNIIGDALDQCRAEVRENFIMPVVRLEKEHSDECNLHGGHYWKNNQFCISLDAFHDIKHKCVWLDSKPITQLSCQKSKCLKVSQDQIYSSWRVHNVATVWGKVLRVMPAHALELHLSCTNPQLLCSTVLSYNDTHEQILHISVGYALPLMFVLMTQCILNMFACIGKEKVTVRQRWLSSCKQIRHGSDCVSCVPSIAKFAH